MNTETQENQASSNRPVSSFQGSGGVHVAVWKSKTESDQDVYSIKIDRRYKDDKDSELKSTPICVLATCFELISWWVRPIRGSSRTSNAPARPLQTRLSDKACMVKKFLIGRKECPIPYMEKDTRLLARADFSIALPNVDAQVQMTRPRHALLCQLGSLHRVRSLSGLPCQTDGLSAEMFFTANSCA